MSITDGTILKVVASCLWSDGMVTQNVFNAVITGAGAPWAEADVVADAVAWADNMFANMTTNVNTSVDGNTIHVYEYDSIDDDWDEVGSDAWTWNPSGTSDQLPRGNAALINLWTTDPDVQGKKYLAGLMEGSILNGLITASVLVDMLAFAADWATVFVGGTSGGTWTPGIWSVAGTVFKAAVDHYAANAIMAYQRRRKRGVGI